MTIIFLTQNAMRYLAPVYDPLFRATRPWNNGQAGVGTLYLSDFYVNALFCADQYLLCNPATSTCTKPVGYLEVQASINNLGFNDQQFATAMRMVNAFGEIGTWTNPFALGVNCTCFFRESSLTC